MKPISGRRLAEAVARARERLTKRDDMSQGLIALQELLQQKKIQKIPAEKTGRHILLDPSEVLYATARGGDTYVRTGTGEYLVRLTLQDLETRLGHPFYRVHKGYIVNLQLVREVIPWFQGNYFLVLKDGQSSQIPVGRNKVKEVRELLGLA